MGSANSPHQSRLTVFIGRALTQVLRRQLVTKAAAGPKRDNSPFRVAIAVAGGDHSATNGKTAARALWNGPMPSKMRVDLKVAARAMTRRLIGSGGDQSRSTSR
jgi:hypothetical protein